MEVVILGAGGHGTDMAEDLVARGFTVRQFDDRFADDRCDTVAFLADMAPWLLGLNWPGDRLAVAAMKPTPPFEGGRWVHRAANIGPQVDLGRHTHVNAGAFLTRVSVGDFCSVGPNATVCGDVTIGHRSVVGAGAVVSHLCSVGSDVTIGAGAVVPPHTVIPDGETWVGVPARPVAHPTRS